MSKVVVIGAGPMGLAAAYHALREGHDVDVLEASDIPGGMAAHFDFGGISIERFYHFVCRADYATFDLLHDLGISDQLVWRPTSMGFFVGGKLNPWGDPVSLLSLPRTSLAMKLRYGLFVFICTHRSSWPALEHRTAKDWIIDWCGEAGYNLFWRSLLEFKFYEDAARISAAWIWTRIRRVGLATDKQAPLTLVVLVWAMVQVVRAVIARQQQASPADRNLRAIEKALAVAVPVTFVILFFFLPASITRYEVIYPIYLLLIAVLPVPYTNRPAFRPYVVAGVALLIVGQFLACILYLAQNRFSAEGPVERYDFVLNCIPDTDKIAASPQLWLAFQTRDRPFSLLYPGLDGLENWKKTSSDPLGRFDVILLTDYVKDDLNRYAPLSAAGKVRRDIPVGRRVLRVYSRPGILADCKDNRLAH